MPTTNTPDPILKQTDLKTAEKTLEPTELTLAEYHEWCGLDAGYCPDCAQFDGSEYYEPDREGGTCSFHGCKGENVMGIEWAFMSDLFNIIEDE